MAGGHTALARGSHAEPGAGRCLMEHVSVLAGERFGALPRCTDPALAGLAVLVNDRIGDARRPQLLARAPALAVARSQDPALAWRFVELAARAVLVRRPGDGPATRRLRRARRARRTRERLLSPVLAGRAPSWVAAAASLTASGELTAAFHALLAAAGPAGGGERDRALLDLLDAAIATTLDGPARVAVPTTEEALVP